MAHYVLRLVLRCMQHVVNTAHYCVKRLHRPSLIHGLCQADTHISMFIEILSFKAGGGL
jgi:hypothetical protein